MKENKTGSRTMLLSILMSAPGPLVEGLALLEGQSATQLADFVRRSAELLALVVAFIVYKKTGSQPEHTRVAMERRSNRCVGAIMCLSGAIMLATALFASKGGQGNVVPGLIIALLGAVANTLFWRKYTRLSHESGNAILAVQGRLYRAKSLVDSVVSLALLIVLLAPGSSLSVIFDRAGSAAVALYLACSGIRILREQTQGL